MPRLTWLASWLATLFLYHIPHKSIVLQIVYFKQSCSSLFLRFNILSSLLICSLTHQHHHRRRIVKSSSFLLIFAIWVGWRGDRERERLHDMMVVVVNEPQQKSACPTAIYTTVSSYFFIFMMPKSTRKPLPLPLPTTMYAGKGTTLFSLLHSTLPMFFVVTSQWQDEKDILSKKGLLFLPTTSLTLLW